jgi:hypothetical protein
MPGSDEEYVRFAVLLDLPPDFPLGQTWLDGSPITEEEAATIQALWIYRRQQLGRQRRAARRRPAQRQALRLLRRYLSPAQLAGLRRNGEFLVTLKSGTAYRIDARRGRTEEVTRHGRRFYVRRRFCLHEHVSQTGDTTFVLPMPPADLALTHLLWLLADEQEFLNAANATDVRDMLWNGQWQRRLRAARLERENLEIA